MKAIKGREGHGTGSLEKYTEKAPRDAVEACRCRDGYPYICGTPRQYDAAKPEDRGSCRCACAITVAATPKGMRADKYAGRKNSNAVAELVSPVHVAYGPWVERDRSTT